MKINLLSITQFKNLWLVMPFFLCVLYLPQAFWGLNYFGGKSAGLLIMIVFVGLIVYCVTRWVLNKIRPVPSDIFSFFKEPGRSSTYFVLIVFVIYFLLVGYVLLTAQKIALVESFRGASVDDIALARESLFKSRIGWERILVYFNAVLSTALMPFAIALIYIEKRKYRQWMLFAFCLSLLPSMEKVLILKALMPLIMLGLNGYFSVKRVLQIIGVAVAIVVAAFALTKAGGGNNLDENNKTLASLSYEKSVVDRLKRDHIDAMNGVVTSDDREWRNLLIREKDIDAGLEYYRWADTYLRKYNVLGFGRVAFFANRILWIPYVTAYDWLGYFDLHLKGQFLHGATSSILAKILGQEPFPMEREVFKFQFGSSGPSSAAANAVFLVDAFVNFGWAGVAFYAFLLAILVFLITMIANPAMQACTYYFLIQISMGGLPGVLFGNGMLLLIFLSIFIRPNSVKNEAHNMRNA
jgi:preprotein translocase subunit SecG